MIETTVDVESKLAQLGELYTYRHKDSVQKYLRAQVDLVDFLFTAYEKIERCFGSSPEIVLELQVEPEPPPAEELFAFIITSLPVDEAEERLCELDQSWFLGQLKKVAGRFNFDLELSTPYAQSC